MIVAADELNVDPVMYMCDALQDKGSRIVLSVVDMSGLLAVQRLLPP